MESIKSIHDRLKIIGSEVWTDVVYVRVSPQIWWELCIDDNHATTYHAYRLRNYKKLSSEPVVQFTVRDIKPKDLPTWVAAECEYTYKSAMRRDLIKNTNPNNLWIN